MRELNYTKAVIIVHGKSEKQICQYIKNKLRLKIEIYSDKNGEKAIQITSLKITLNNKIFKTLKSFIHEYDDIKLINNKQISSDFKLFIIMDTDDCTEKQKQNFINKEMFKSHWAYEYIVPIYNIPELETVLVKAKIPFERKGNERKKEYVKIFPTDPKYEKNDNIQIEELSNTLKKQDNTNLNIFLDFCTKFAK